MLYRKVLRVLTLLFVGVIVASCGSESSRTSNVKKVIESQVQLNESTTQNFASNNSDLTIIEETEPKVSQTVKVDLDLTEYTSVVADAYLKQLQDNMDKYRGITVKAKGEYSHFVDPNTKKDYYNCVFASSCCPNGLEFILSDTSNYPTEEGKDITVVGNFNYYEENGVVFFNLINAELV